MNRLLIVDDHALVREGLKRALTHEGFNEIFEACSVGRAWCLYLKICLMHSSERNAKVVGSIPTRSNFLCH